MELEHHFTVPASVEETWAAFNDPELVAPCFPGATLISVDGDQFTGSAKVKLGPIALQYRGVGTYIERDEHARKAVIEAKGKDQRGNGTANAMVTARLMADGGGTSVHVTTDLAVTGKPAQFGRGVMQDVSDKLLLQFVACLQAKLAAPAALDDTAAEVTPAAEVIPPPDRGVAGGAAPAGTRAPGHRPAPPRMPAMEAELHLLNTLGRVLLTRYAARALGPVAFVVGYLLGRRSRR